jgi:hypothetical protein
MSKTTYFKQHTYTPNEFYDYMRQIEKAMALGTDIVAKIDFTALDDYALADINDDGLDVDIPLRLEDSDGNLHTWFNRTLTATVATSGNGEVIDRETGLASVDIEFVEGEATLKLTLLDEVTGAAWVNEETATLTLADGQEVLNSGDLVETLVFFTVEVA